MERFHQFYKEFQQLLQELRSLSAQAQPDSAALQQAFLAAQQLFQLRLAGFDLDELPETATSKVQSYQTEISKQLRLLGTDVAFLQAAKQPVTAQRRQAQIISRIDTLLRYCSAIFDQD